MFMSLTISDLSGQPCLSALPHPERDAERNKNCWNNQKHGDISEMLQLILNVEKIDYLSFSRFGRKALLFRQYNALHAP